ncbi:hypothetical protein N836_13720 [Leptolyngbya sp. Heron Island J]|nr:hypothetical protein [Leptolyngbya sp. Heron Island J]ESA35118.1 hypothetical protein N836_13720 [Leptolyngbya sp. Heron Island J]
MPTVVIEVIVEKLIEVALVLLWRWGWRYMQKWRIARSTEQLAEEENEAVVEGSERSHGRCG